MIDSRNLFNGENVESLKMGANRRAEGVLEQLDAKTRDIGNTNRVKVLKEVLSEVLINTYTEGRLSALMDFEQKRRMDAVDALLSEAKDLNYVAKTVYKKFFTWILVGQGVVLLMAAIAFILKLLGK